MIIKLRKRKKGFTLVELVIVIAIVIVLSVVSVPIYNNYVEKAMYTEGYALLGTILTAQKIYYTEYGYFLRKQESNKLTCNEPILGVDARGNKYFTCFFISSTNVGGYFHAAAKKPTELIKNNKTYFRIQYNLSSISGAIFDEADLTV